LSQATKTPAQSNATSAKETYLKSLFISVFSPFSLLF